MHADICEFIDAGNIMMTLQNITRIVALIGALMLTAILMNACPDRDNITDCSHRNKPQRWDGEKWTCG
jgi:hypothetical protein